MDPHLISATLPLEDQQAINAAIDTLRQKLPFPIDLTAAERVRMAKAADKTATFVRKAVEVANERPRDSRLTLRARSLTLPSFKLEFRTSDLLIRRNSG